MIEFKIGKHSAQLPTRWGELTFDQFYRLRKSNDDLLEVLSILSGIDIKIWQQTSDLDLDYKIKPYIDWMLEPFDLSAYLVPDKIEIAGGLYPRPKGIGLQSFGQKIALEKFVSKVEAEGGYEHDTYAYIIALYMQPTITGVDYDDEKVDKIYNDALNVKLEQGWPLASFFLQNYEKYKLRRKENFITLLAKKRLQQELKGLEDSPNFRLYSPLRKLTIKLLKMFSGWSTRLYFLHSSIKLSKVATKKG